MFGSSVMSKLLVVRIIIIETLPDRDWFAGTNFQLTSHQYA